MQGNANRLSGGMPSVSIALCTFERPQELAQTLEDVARELPADGEVVVIDQSRVASSQNYATTKAMGDARFRYLWDPIPGLPRARNAAIAETRAENLVFFDDDVRLLPGVIAAHGQALARDGVGAVVGRLIENRVKTNAPPGTNWIGHDGRVRFHLHGGQAGEVQALKGANMSFRREALLQVGSFDEAYLGTAILEEADISERIREAGWKIWFEPRAALIHLAAPAGGVRRGPREAERWRFENTGYFVAKHRPQDERQVRATFFAIAVRRAWEWGDRSVISTLMGAIENGFQRGRHGG